MTLNPRNLIFPSVLACSVCLALLSMTIHTGFAQQSTQPSANIETGANYFPIKLSSKFPENIQQWEAMIEDAAAETGLDPDLIAAVMLQESGGDPFAYSSSGAVGLMQIMPKDGIASEFICENRPCFMNRPTINELSDPNFNIQYGSNYLAGLVKLKESVREALRTYGPMDVEYSYADIVLVIYENYQ
jgi:hypothetical protein